MKILVTDVRIVQIFGEINKMVEYEEEIIETHTIECKHCGETDIHKVGKKHGIQYFKCNSCERKFADNNAYPGMRYSKDYNLQALTSYYNGMSYRGLNHTFNDMYDEWIPRSTFFRWIIKFSKMVHDYVLSLQPQLSSTWIADETVIDVSGRKYWYWDIIDEGTRFLIASHLSRNRSVKEATKLFYMAKLRSKTRPNVIRTDKMVSYHKAFNEVFYARSWDKKVLHLTSEGFDSPFNTNLIERFHGTIKQRYKVMRDFKTSKTARITLDGFLTHYNFFLEHDYLDGMTPAMKAGIGNEIYDWGNLIELAQITPKRNPGFDIDWEKEFGIK